MEIKERIKNYWNKRCKDFTQLRISELNSEKRDLWLNIICPKLDYSKRLNILDIGTGSGFLAILMASLGHKVTGIDLSPSMIKSAKKLSRDLKYNIDFKIMDAENLNFPNDNFDVIVSRNLTWTLPNIEKGYKEWYRVLKPQGILMNFDANYGNVSFYNESKTLKKDNAHKNMDDILLKECDDIKNNLSVSFKKRPFWDIEFLTSLGFQCSWDCTISDKIYATEDKFCNPTKMFALYCIK
ncbi:MAG: class I SAM-dependent methyltransferase [Clostridium perfringens]|nr:class I SAM-dependent methyltransferase [Clostridium perfringens]